MENEEEWCENELLMNNWIWDIIHSFFTELILQQHYLQHFTKSFCTTVIVTLRKTDSLYCDKIISQNVIDDQLLQVI